MIKTCGCLLTCILTFAAVPATIALADAPGKPTAQVQRGSLINSQMPSVVPHTTVPANIPGPSSKPVMPIVRKVTSPAPKPLTWQCGDWEKSSAKIVGQRASFDAPLQAPGRFVTCGWKR